MILDEWLYALDLVKEVLHKKVTLRGDAHWLPFIADLSDSFSRIESLNICVFSLTAMSNQLSQWRAYCPPEGGYNLAFQTSLLQPHLDRHGFQLRQCVYNRNEQMREIETVVENILATVGVLTDEHAIESAKNTALDHFIRELSMVAPVLKHPDFKEEQEWRAFSLVHPDDVRMEYHLKGPLAVPHCVLEIKTAMLGFPLSQITVGPNAHQSLAQRGINALA